MTQPFEPARWDLVPGGTALVLIDLQRDFLHPDGWYAQSGVDIDHMRRVIEPTRRLVAAARAASVPIVWTRHGFRGPEDAGPFFELRPFLRDGGLRRRLLPAHARADRYGLRLRDERRVHPARYL